MASKNTSNSKDADDLACNSNGLSKNSISNIQNEDNTHKEKKRKVSESDFGLINNGKRQKPLNIDNKNGFSSALSLSAGASETTSTAASSLSAGASEITSTSASSLSAGASETTSTSASSLSAGASETTSRSASSLSAGASNTTSRRNSKNLFSGSINSVVSAVDVVDGCLTSEDNLYQSASTERCEIILKEPDVNVVSIDSKNRNTNVTHDQKASKVTENSEENLNLEFAVEFNLIDVASSLLDSGANPDIVKHEHDGEILECILHVACSKGFKNMVELLIKHKANVQILNYKKKNALHLAAEAGNYELCKLLLENKCYVNCEDEDGRLPLHFAVKNLDVTKLLVNHGSILNHVDYNGYTPLLEACVEGNTNTVDYLIKEGADVNITDLEKRTALMISCNRGDLKIVECLLKSSINVNASSVNGMTALHNAVCAHSGTQVIKALIESDCKLDSKDIHGWTPLIYSIQMIRPKSIKTLLLANCSTEFTMSMLMRSITPFQLCLLQLEQMTLFTISEQKYDAVNNLFMILRMLLSIGVEAIPPPKPLHSGLDNIAKCAKCLSEKGYGTHAIESTEMLEYSLKNALRLTLLSRKVIRSCLGKNTESKVQKLNLPLMINDYILLSELHQILSD